MGGGDGGCHKESAPRFGPRWPSPCSSSSSLMLDPCLFFIVSATRARLDTVDPLDTQREETETGGGIEVSIEGVASYPSSSSCDGTVFDSWGKEKQTVRMN